MHCGVSHNTSTWRQASSGKPFESLGSQMFEKVFCIGLNRTGTKSFASAMRILGYRPQAWKPDAMNDYISGRTDRLYELVEMFDTFDDWPWPLMARDLMIRFPNAGFILTYRSSEFVWLESIKRHAIKAPGGRRFRKHVFGSSEPSQNEEQYLQFYRDHYSHVLQTVDELKCHDRVLPACWELGDGWGELCTFLDRTRPNRPFPHLNRICQH